MCPVPGLLKAYLSRLSQSPITRLPPAMQGVGGARWLQPKLQNWKIGLALAVWLASGLKSDKQIRIDLFLNGTYVI